VENEKLENPFDRNHKKLFLDYQFFLMMARNLSFFQRFLWIFHLTVLVAKYKSNPKQNLLFDYILIQR
jgi:hypothetical protein